MFICFVDIGELLTITFFSYCIRIYYSIRFIKKFVQVEFNLKIQKEVIT